jgi:hypothetical protein
MITEMLLYGFVSAFGWWGANHFVIEPMFEKPASMEKEKQEQKCTDWEEKKNPDGTIHRFRTCDSLSKTSP